MKARIVTVMGVLVLSTAAVSVSAAESLSVLLQKGIFAGETEVNLEAAIKIFQQIRAEAAANRSVVAQAQYRLDCDAHRLFREKREVVLTPKEFGLLEYMAQHPGRALTRQRILELVWGNDVIVTERSVDRCVNTLRSEVELAPENPRFIKTIRDTGCRFEVPSANPDSCDVLYSPQNGRKVEHNAALNITRVGAMDAGNVRRSTCNALYHYPTQFAQPAETLCHQNDSARHLSTSVSIAHPPGDEVASYSAARKRGFHATLADFSASPFGCGCAALRISM